MSMLNIADTAANAFSPATFAFYAASVVAIISALRVVTNSNPVHGLLSLIVTLMSVAALFFILGAPFAGALEILVYAGAILVLFVFVVMMLNLGSETIAQEKKWQDSATLAVPAGLALLLGISMLWLLGSAAPSGKVLGTAMVDAKAVGISLFGGYLLLVEFASLLLLSALVAAYHLGKKALPEADRQSEENLAKQYPHLAKLTQDTAVQGAEHDK